MKRSSFAKTPKQKKCKICPNSFTPRFGFETWCSPDCGYKVHEAKTAKAAAKEAAQDKRQTKAQLEAMKPLGKLRAAAILSAQRFARARDRAAGHGCICCGERLDWTSSKPGGAVDGGHFVSKGSAPELALVEININAQRKGCNRPGGTTREKFRAGMVKRYGEELIAWLEGPHEIPHYKHDDYRKIKADYDRQARELEKNFQQA